MAWAGELLEVDRLVARSNIQNSVAFVSHFQAINRRFVESGYPKLSILASLLKVSILDDFGVLHFKNEPPALLPSRCSRSINVEHAKSGVEING